MFQEKSQFQARSGRTIKVGEDGTLIFDHVNGYLGADSVMDAEEFFQAKSDEEIGRWRYPSEPDLVVREINRDTFGRRRVRVLNERTFHVRDVNEVMAKIGTDFGHVAASAYFDAHPERKPWEDAKPGEVWTIAVDGIESYTVNVVAEVFGVSFRTPHGNRVNMHNSTFTGFRRVWPEDAS